MLPQLPHLADGIIKNYVRNYPDNYAENIKKYSTYIPYRV